MINVNLSYDKIKNNIFEYYYQKVLNSVITFPTNYGLHNYYTFMNTSPNCKGMKYFLKAIPLRGSNFLLLLYWLFIVFSCIGLIYKYRMWRNVFGMSSTPSHPMDNSAMDVRLAFPSELTHYYLTLAWVWQVSYFNPP